MGEKKEIDWEQWIKQHHIKLKPSENENKKDISQKNIKGGKENDR